MASSVREMTAVDFQEGKPWKLKGSQCAFVLFYADWCPHCVDFKPEYSNFADVAQFLTVGQVNIEREKGLMEKLKGSPVEIKTFPTVWMFCCGEPVRKYEGERTVGALMEAAQKLCSAECDCTV